MGEIEGGEGKLQNYKVYIKIWQNSGMNNKLWRLPTFVEKEMRVSLSHQWWNLTPSTMREVNFSWNILWFRSCQTIQMVAVTTHWLASSHGILEILQSPQREEIDDGQENNARRPRSDAQIFKVWGQWKKISVLVFRLTPQNIHDDVIWMSLLARLSAVKRR